MQQIRRALTATGAVASVVHRLMVVRRALDRAFRSEPKLKTCICPCTKYIVNNIKILNCTILESNSRPLDP